FYSWERHVTMMRLGFACSLCLCLDRPFLGLPLVDTPGLGYPLLLSLGKSLIVIVSYALTTEQPDPCGPEPYSPGKRLRTRSSLGKGPVAPRIPGVALSQNSLGHRTSRGVP